MSDMFSTETIVCCTINRFRSKTNSMANTIGALYILDEFEWLWFSDRMRFCWISASWWTIRWHFKNEMINYQDQIDLKLHTLKDLETKLKLPLEETITVVTFP